VQGPAFEKLFAWCYDYRRTAVMRGESTPIMDMFVFNNLRMLFGGKIRAIICGKSPKKYY